MARRVLPRGRFGDVWQPGSGTGANVGRLLVGGYLGRVSLNYTGLTQVGKVDDATNTNVAPFRFCPSQRDGAPPTAAQIVFHSSYLINPHIAASNYNVPITSTTYGTATWFRRLSQFPPQLCMACEWMSGYSVATPGNIRNYVSASTFTPPHKAGGVDAYYWNLLYADGHVATVKDNKIYNPSTIFYWGPGIGYALTGRQFPDCLDVLETEADGRDPAKAVALPNYAVQNPYRYTRYPFQGSSWKDCVPYP